MDNRRDFAAAFLLSAVLVVLALGFSASINIGSFRQNYTNALMSSFAVAGDKAARTIEQALGYGKDLEDFYDIEKTLAAVMARIPMADDVQVALPDGRIIYTYRGSTNLKIRSSSGSVPTRNSPDGATIPTSILIPANTNCICRSGEPIRPPCWDGHHRLGPVGDRRLRIAVSGPDYRLLLDPWHRHDSGTGGGAADRLDLGSRPWRHGPGTPFMTLAALAAVQIAAGVESYSLSTTAYIETAERSTEIVGSMIAADIESVIWRGACHCSLHGLDQYFNQITATVPHIRKISLDFERTAQPSAPEPRNGLAEARDLEIRTLMAPDEAGNEPMLVMVVDGAAIAGQLREIALDMASLLVTSLMFMLEINGFLNSEANRRPQVTDIGGAGRPSSPCGS